MSAAPLLDREFLERLERLTIHWQKSFAGLVGGHNRSRFAGSGQEFLDHRNFHHGDDLRAVNWRAYMRLEKLFLKMFQVEPRVPVRMLVDLSESMTAHGGQKLDYARKLAASLCYVGMVRLDTIEVHGFSHCLEQRILATGGRHRFSGVMNGLAALKSGGATDYMAMVREFIHAYAGRGLVIILSDFLDEDRTPPWLGELELRDAETGAALKLDFDARARARYTHAFDEHAGQIQSIAMRSGGRYSGISTSQALETVIFGDLIKTRGIA
jgi:uncharacterized protein (DUF58 family)